MDLLRDEPERRASVLRRERVFEGRVWNVVTDEVAFAGGTIVRDYVQHRGAVAILALDEEDRALVIRQYRHPIRRRDWELPAGILDVAGERPVDAARRELAEEVDMSAASWAHLIDYYSSPGGSDEVLRIFLARGLSPVPGFARTDEEAELETAWVALDDLVASALAGGIGNPGLLIGALSADAARRAGWATLRPVDTPWPLSADGPDPSGAAGRG